MLAVKSAVRADVRNGLIAGAEVPFAGRGEDDVAGAWRTRDRRDLNQAVWVVGVDRRLVGGASVESAQVGAKAEWISAQSTIAETRPFVRDDGRAAVARADLAAVYIVRQQDQVDGWPREQCVGEMLPAMPQRAPERTMPLLELDVHVRHCIAADHHRRLRRERENPWMRHHPKAERGNPALEVVVSEHR